MSLIILHTSFSAWQVAVTSLIARLRRAGFPPRRKRRGFQPRFHEIADDAMLVNMSARPVYDPIEYDQHQALKLSFLFIRPSGEQFNVSFNTMQPDKTVTTEDRGQLDFPLS